MVCHSLLQWTTYSQTSPPWPTRLGWPHRAWFSFVELDKAVVLVWLDWLVFCEYGFMCLPSDALSQHLPSYLGFSYLGRGVSLHSHSSWPERGLAPFVLLRPRSHHFWMWLLHLNNTWIFSITFCYLFVVELHCRKRTSCIWFHIDAQFLRFVVWLIILTSNTLELPSLIFPPLDSLTTLK